MKRVCCYCRKDMGEKSDEGAEPGSVSHGICEECLARVLEDRRRQDDADPFFVLSD